MRLYNQRIFASLLIVISLLMASCSSCQSSQNAAKESATDDAPSMTYEQLSPHFDADNAFLYVKKQVDFGPRVPNSAAHIACGNYLVQKLEEFGAQVIEQKTILKTYDGIALDVRNIIGVYNPDQEKRILLFAHWDSRPFADQETEMSKQNKPILGANDGGSGVGCPCRCR